MRLDSLEQQDSLEQPERPEKKDFLDRRETVVHPELSVCLDQTGIQGLQVFREYPDQQGAQGHRDPWVL